MPTIRTNTDPKGNRAHQSTGNDDDGCASEGPGSHNHETNKSSPAALDDVYRRYLICPITREMFRDPVVAADGETYEREAIQAWFSLPVPGFPKGHCTSPLTRRPLRNTSLSPNNYIRRMCREWSEEVLSGGKSWDFPLPEDPNGNKLRGSDRPRRSASMRRIAVAIVFGSLVLLALGLDSSSGPWSSIRGCFRARYPHQQHMGAADDTPVAAGTCQSGRQTHIVAPAAVKAFIIAQKVVQGAQWLLLHRQHTSPRRHFSLIQQEAFPDLMTSEKSGLSYYVRLADFVRNHPRGSAERSLVETQVEHLYEIARSGSWRGVSDSGMLLMTEQQPPVYSLDPNPKHLDPLHRYFVSNKDRFGLTYPEGTAARALVEARVEMDLKMRLEIGCFWELAHYRLRKQFADLKSQVFGLGAQNTADGGKPQAIQHESAIQADVDTFRVCEQLQDLWPVASSLGHRWFQQEMPWPPSLNQTLWAALSM